MYLNWKGDPTTHSHGPHHSNCSGNPGGCRQRNHHLASHQRKQLGAADPQSTEGRLPKALTIKPRIDTAIDAWLADQPLAPKPVVDHEPVNDDLQTGESRLLGGAMSVHAPWKNETEQNPSN